MKNVDFEQTFHNNDYDLCGNPVFLIFGGTSEGRKLAEFLSCRGIPAVLCVATEYGGEVLPKHLPHIQVRTGRMNERDMEKLFSTVHFLAVVDATHPYAEAVTENIRSACEKTGQVYKRLIRRETPLSSFSGLRVFDDCASAADWLQTQRGNILLTTGMKELPEFAARIADKSRIYARVLLQEEVPAQAERLGLSKKQMICMQGPFSKEMNVATLHMTDAAFLVTKESGKNGGFSEKAEAAKEAGAVCVVIRRPVKETGKSLEEICELLQKLWETHILRDVSAIAQSENDRGEIGNERFTFSSPKEKTKSPQITLLGIGMGGADQLTVEAVRACEHADCIIGATRMLDSLKGNGIGVRHFPPQSADAFAKTDGTAMIPIYKAEEIVDFIKKHPEYQEIVVAFSGDVGFYSGAKGLLERIADRPEFGAYRVQCLCGISSVAYFAAKLQIPWEDMVLVSTHGREQNLVGAVRKNKRVFTLASDAKSIRGIADKLIGFGLGSVRMYVGANLSYPDERIDVGTVYDFLNYNTESSYDCKDMRGKICVAVFENPLADSEVCVHGIPDELFFRGKVPMTKEEVRSVAVSKLRLMRNSVVYDIGAGTGSVSVECARIADKGRVYAIEWKEDAWKLVAENRKRFALSNLEIVAGRAPEALENLPSPTHAFVGGTGGELRRILKALLQKNPHVRIVVNAITLETVSETLAAARDYGLSVIDIASVTIAKSKKVGDYHMMTGQNPVYVITLFGEGDNQA